MDLGKQKLLYSQQIYNFCVKYHILKSSYFGSVVRDDFSPHSDIDVLVEFKPGHIHGLDFFLMEVELTRLLGRKVDIAWSKVIAGRSYSKITLKLVLKYGTISELGKNHRIFFEAIYTRPDRSDLDWEGFLGMLIFLGAEVKRQSGSAFGIRLTQWCICCFP